MMESILKDNLMYLDAWFEHNPLFKEVLTVEDNYLLYNHGEEKLKIDSFYLPEMLNNENFRHAIATPDELSGKDLFEIIYCYINSKEIEEKNKMVPSFIKDVFIRQKNGEEFLVFVTEDERKYRFDTDNPEKIINYIKKKLKMGKK